MELKNETENDTMVDNKELVKIIEFDHILKVINYCFEMDRKTYNYSKDNMQTMAVTIHPHFTVWLCACQLYNVGGEIMKSNAIDEVFGTDQFNEGTHSMFALETFSQLGSYKIEHYQRCKQSLLNVYRYVNHKKINVLYSFLICCELASFLFIDFQNSCKQYKVKDLFYFDVHLQADNLNDGHGIMMLKELINGDVNITLDEINTGIKVFRDLFSCIFNYTPPQQFEQIK